MEVNDAPDTGQKEQSFPRNTPATRGTPTASIFQVGPQEKPKGPFSPSPLSFDKTSLTQGLTQFLSIQSSDLGNFAKKRSRLDTPGLIALDQASELTGSPRSNRMQDLFPGDANTHSLKEMVGKLLEVIKAGFPLANKSKKAQKISVNVSTAADILVITGAVYERVMYDEARRNFTTPEALIGANQKNRPIIFKGKATDDKLDSLTEQIALLTSAVGHLLPNKQKPRDVAAPSYALVASKHAPGKTPAVFKPSQARPPPAKVAPKPRATNVVSLAHEPGSDITHPGLSNAKLIQELNLVFRAYKINLKPEDKAAIEIKSVRRHPSNNIDLYFETAAHALKVREMPRTWVQGFSKTLKMKEARHEIIVNGISKTFDPNIPDHVEELQVCNGALLKDMLSVCWLNPKALEDPEKRHSLLLISLKTKEQAQLCVKEKIWHGRGRHITLRSGPPPRRCYNCQKTGHTAPACPLPPLCPFCGEKHHSHTCPENGKTSMKCTACARKKVTLEPQTNLKALFASNPVDLIHHPFSPVCPTRIATAAPPHNPSASPKIVIIEEGNMNLSQ